MIHGYDARLKTYTYNICYAMGNPKCYLDAAAEEEAWLAAFVQLGKRGSCLPMQAEAGCPKSPQVEQLWTNLQVMALWQFPRLKHLQGS